MYTGICADSLSPKPPPYRNVFNAKGSRGLLVRWKGMQKATLKILYMGLPNEAQRRSSYSNMNKVHAFLGLCLEETTLYHHYFYV